MSQDINRRKVAPADIQRANYWLAERLSKDPAMVSKRRANKPRFNLDALVRNIQMYKTA